MKKIFLFLISLNFFLISNAQVSKWLVRNSNATVRLLDFTMPTPTVSPTIIGFGTGGHEDVNLITDANDNILFLTAVNSSNVIEVWDSTFQIMPNGGGLIGASSTLESGIVRRPCTNDQYFFVHLQQITQELYYSSIDLSLNSGLGDVVTKNNSLGGNHTEGLAISHQMNNGCRWLITGKVNGNTFEVYRYLISDAGIASPTLIGSSTVTNIVNHVQEMELSPDNTKLAMSTLQSDNSAIDVVVWDFDLNTGNISNPTNYIIPNVPNVLGVEFSPNSEFLYFRSNSSSSVSFVGRIDLTTGNIDIIDNNMGSFGTQIEAAGNGKIYISWNTSGQHLSEIADPNNSDINNIGFTKNAILINSTGMRPGIPNAIDGELPGTTVTPQYIAFGAVPTANCNEFQFVDTTCLGTWWEWNFGDGNFSNVQSPVHQYSSNGSYTVTLRTVACGDTLVLSKANFISATGIFNVSLNPFSNVDIATAPFALTGGSPAGGTYSGPGVTSGMFDASVAGLGTHTITYTYTDSLGCTGSATATITVNQSVIVTLDPFADVCIDDTPFTLTGGSPSGGLYAGPGITNGLFDPSMTGVGTHTIVYTVNNTSASQDITVHALPVVTLASFPNVDVTTAAFTLTGGIPSGGIYSGPGVSNGMFDPAVAGIGTHTIIYNYTDGNGCSNSATAPITVDPAIVVTFDPINPLCVNASAITLTGGLPAGGVYSGTGVVNGMFNPSVAGAGSHSITYTFNGQSALQTITVYPLPVVTLSISGGTIGCDNAIIIGYNNTPIVITATSSTAISYQWYHDGNLIIGANSSTLNVTTGGTYSVSVTDIYGCMSDPNAPGATINFNGINASCGNNNNKVLLCHYPPGNNGNPQTLCISANAVPAHIANHPGDCIGPCPGARLLAPVIESMHYHLSPNPVTDKAELSFMTYRNGNVKIDLLDFMGRNLKSIYNEITEGDIEYTLEIDAEGIIAGIYFLRIESPDGVVTEKMTIVK